jgi:hypothetical protein
MLVTGNSNSYGPSFITVRSSIGFFFLGASIRFVRGIKPGRNTGYDMDDDDLLDMEQCHGVVVASAIFGNVL